MNKLLTSVLALVLLFSLSAFAAENDTEDRINPKDMAVDADALAVATGNESARQDDADQANDSVGQDGDVGPVNGDAVAEQVRAQVREKIQAGTFAVGEKQMIVQTRANNRLHIETNGEGAETAMELMQEDEGGVNTLKAQLSNGRIAEIKVMPDRAAENALEQLRLRVCAENCEIELKEVGNGNETRAAYEVKAQKQARILGIFGSKMNVEAQVDAETGEVMNTKRPWWSFMARVVEDEDDTGDAEETENGE